MNDGDPLGPQEQRVRAALQGLPPVEAAPEFRERLRREFVAGTIGARTRKHRTWPRVALAAALLLAAGSVIERANRSAPWVLGATSETGSVRIDGETVAVTERALLARLLVPGSHVTTDAQAELQLESPGAVVLVITPGTSTVLPAVPGRWFGRTVRARLAHGELRGTTGPRFAGARLIVAAPEATAEITGTTFAVLHDAEGSCVCVLEGSVILRDRTGAAPVAPGRRRAVPPGGGPALDQEIRPMERMKLEMLLDQAKPRLAIARR